MTEQATKAPETDAAASSRSPESYERLASPVLRSAWLLRTSAIVGVVASGLGAVIVPGLRGIASDKVITSWETIAAALAYAMGFFLAGLLLTGAFDLSRTRKVGLAPRALILLGAPGVLSMLVPAFARALTPVGSMILVIATLLVVIGGASAGLRAAHTRALAAAQIVYAFAAFARLAGWMIATLFADSVRLYVVSRTFTVAGVVTEGIAQALIVAWLSMRRRMSISAMTAIALLASFMIVWTAGRADASAPAWQVVLRAGIAGQVTQVAPSTLGALEAFFVVASLFLALACALMRHPLAVIVCAMSLALLARGAYDVPLRALAATVAAIWTTLAASDERALWKSLTAPRD
jgi:hypothetical protein